MKTQIEDVERSCLRLVVRAIQDYYSEAIKIFQEETDLPSDIAEDITREALDALGISRIPIRLYGKVDYKKAAFVFLPDREIEVALMVDSKAEKDGNSATIQMSQTSMEVHQHRGGEIVHVKGKLPPFIERSDIKMQTITITIKYIYDEKNSVLSLKNIKIACIPNGLLQDDYNPNEDDNIWLAGRNAPTLGEEFRVRLSYAKLKKKAGWRVVELQNINKGNYMY